MKKQRLSKTVARPDGRVVETALPPAGWIETGYQDVVEWVHKYGPKKDGKRQTVRKQLTYKYVRPANSLIHPLGPRWYRRALRKTARRRKEDEE